MNRRLQFAIVATISALTMIPLISIAASFFYVGNSGNIGIGNDSPANKLDVSGTIYSRLVTVTDGASTTVDWSAANVQSITLTTSNTTFTFSNPQAGATYTLILNQDGTGSRTVTWPVTVKWAQATTPVLTTAASSTDEVHFVYDGTNYLGTYALNYAIPSSPIAFDNSTSTQQTTQNPSFSYTVSGSNPLLTVVLYENSGSDDVTGVSYGGGGLTQTAKVTLSSGNVCYEYTLVGPSTGSNTLSISRSSSGNGQNLGISVASYDNVKQSGFPDASHTTTGTAVGTISDSVTTVADNAWVLTGYCSANSGSVSAGSGTTERTFDSGVYSGIFDSNAPVHPAGSKSLNVSNSGKGSDRWGLMTVSFAPAN